MNYLFHQNLYNKFIIEFDDPTTIYQIRYMVHLPHEYTHMSTDNNILCRYQLDLYIDCEKATSRLHRYNDLPAKIYKNGTKIWYKHGQRHRDNDLPAEEYIDGSKVWSKNGKVHHDNDLPAFICGNGSKYWYKNDQLHRGNNLPAVMCCDGYVEFFRNGVQYEPIIYKN